MKNEIKKVSKITTGKIIKVRLDSKTYITISDIASLEVWRKRYPNATVVE